MLVVTPTIHNLGQIKFGTKQTFEYLVTNTYQVPIIIDKIVAGCSSCTKTQIDKNSLTSHETGRLRVTFTPGYLGLQTKTITIISFAGQALLPQVKIKFKAFVNE